MRVQAPEIFEQDNLAKLRIEFIMTRTSKVDLRSRLSGAMRKKSPNDRKLPNILGRIIKLNSP